MNYTSNAQDNIPSFPFNWAAFFITPLWLIGHRKFMLAIIVIFIFAISNSFPLTTFNIWMITSLLVFQLFIALYFGFKGNMILWKSGRFESKSQLITSQRTWNAAGIFLGIAYLTGLFFQLFGRSIVEAGLGSVLAVVLIVFLGIFGYLFVMNASIKQIEDRIKIKRRDQDIIN